MKESSSVSVTNKFHSGKLCSAPNKIFPVRRWFSIYVRIFCELRSILPGPAGARKNTSNERNVSSYYMLNHRIRGLFLHSKKNFYFAIGFNFFGKSIQKHPDFVCENDVNNGQNVREYYTCQIIEREVDYFTAKKIYYFGFYFLVRVSKTSWFCLCEWRKQHESQLNVL